MAERKKIFQPPGSEKSDLNQNSEIVLEFKNISKTFKSKKGNIVKALKHVDLTVNRGECVGVVGESGSGKSTLARVACHLTDATDGTFYFKEKNVTQLSHKAMKSYYQKVQMIFQDPLGTFSPRMKIVEYLVEPFVNFGIMKRRSAETFAETLLERVGLSHDFLYRYPSMLSGGQLQRVVIARAIGLKPELIICDECTSALDATIQQQIIQLFQELREETGFSSLFITHDLALAENVCDKIYVMQDGVVVEILKSSNIVKEASHPYTLELLQSVFTIEPKSNVHSA